MDWNQQMKEMMGSWTDMQRRMWESWVNSIKQFSGQAPQGAEGLQGEYRKHLEAWEASVNQALEAQNDWARKWSEQMNADQQAPEVLEQWNGQLQAMMKGWTESQQQLWTAWLESMRTMAPGQDAGQWGQESKKVMEAWQQAAERAQETLADWTRQVQAQGGQATQQATATATDAGDSSAKDSGPASRGASSGKHTRSTKK